MSSLNSQEGGASGAPRHLVYRVTGPRETFEATAWSVAAYGAVFDSVLVLVRPTVAQDFERHLEVAQESDPGSNIQVQPFDHVDHAGRVLALATYASEPVAMTDDSLAGPTRDLVAALRALPSGPVASLFGFESRPTPLTIPGGLLRVDPAWLRLPEAGQLLRSRRCGTWLGLGATLSELLGEPVPSLYPTRNGPWLETELEAAILSGTPLIPWVLFGADPLELGRLGIDARPALDHLVAGGTELRPVWSRLLATVEPQVWHANLRLLTVTDPRVDVADLEPRAQDSTLTTAVVMHVFYLDMLEEMVGYAANVPSPAALFITTDTERKAEEIRSVLGESDLPFSRWDVRVVASNQGRDIPAFLIDCADVLRDERYDLVVKLHSKKSAQTPAVMGEYFKDHLFINLVGTPGQAAQIKRLFEDEPQLGMVFPPMIHMGYPTMGNGWMANRYPAAKIARRLGFSLGSSGSDKSLPRPKVVASDRTTPLAPYGSMYWARREALLPLVEAQFRYDEYPQNDAYFDGSLAHVLERLTAYVVFSQGFYARSVQTRDSAQFTDLALQAKLAAFSSELPGSSETQVKAAAALSPIDFEGKVVRFYAALIRVSPGAAKVGKHGWKAVKATIEFLKAPSRKP